jgi:hypothetical protein
VTLMTAWQNGCLPIPENDELKSRLNRDAAYKPQQQGDAGGVDERSKPCRLDRAESNPSTGRWVHPVKRPSVRGSLDIVLPSEHPLAPPTAAFHPDRCRGRAPSISDEGVSVFLNENEISESKVLLTEMRVLFRIFFVGGVTSMTGPSRASSHQSPVGSRPSSVLSSGSHDSLTIHEVRPF